MFYYRRRWEEEMWEQGIKKDDEEEYDKNDGICFNKSRIFFDILIKAIKINLMILKLLNILNKSEEMHMQISST